MIPIDNYIKEYERIKNEECNKKYRCLYNNAGICMWQKHSGQECNSDCERFQKCFMCKDFATCEADIEVAFDKYLESCV